MRQLELLAPARDLQVGIAAIDCGADAVYIAGPQFGARQAAGNTIEDIRLLCEYAHRYGARIFVTLNTILYDSELEAAYRQIEAVQEAGADAIIIQDMAILEMARNGINNKKFDLKIPLHASTQCAIRTPEQAIFLEKLGFSRIILERELSLEQIKAIRDAVTCEIEFFVHGALCVCYSGQCYLSEKIAGRSANRGACIQACRSRYDLTDASGKVLIKDKAILSLKDFNLKNRLEELAEAGITSFKIEGRLKSISYVKNVVRDYSIALDMLIEKHPDLYERGSYGKVYGGFEPDTVKTFNRGYTELFIDGTKGEWAAMDAAKSMGEAIGKITSIGKDGHSITISPFKGNTILNNGDGFSFVAKDGSVVGFRGDICEGKTIRSRNIPQVHCGTTLYRNIDAAFEKGLEKQACSRRLNVDVELVITSSGSVWNILAKAHSEDGRYADVTLQIEAEQAMNQERMSEIIAGQIGKATVGYNFSLSSVHAEQGLPFMAASFLNGIRRSLAEAIDGQRCNKKDILNRCLSETISEDIAPFRMVSYKQNVSNHLAKGLYKRCGVDKIEDAYEIGHQKDAELMRSKYCVRYEIGLCPKYHGCKSSGPLYLLNNGQRFTLHFDCANCEMHLFQ